MFKVLNISNNQEDCKRFSQISEKLSGGSKAPISYLQNAQTFVFANAKTPNNWIAGVAINTHSNFRYFACMSEADKAQILKDFGIEEDKIAEMSCMWFSKSISFWDKMFVYLFIVSKVLQSGKKIILAGSFIKKVQDLHMQVLKNLIYSGKVTVAGREGVAKIYFGYRNEILTNLWKGIYFLVKRQLKSKLPQFRKSAPVSVLPA